MTRVLVTGAAGFIGSHLCEALARDGHSVIGWDAFTEHYDRSFKELNVAGPRAHAGFSIVEADLGDPTLRDAVADVDWVLHLAARPGVRESWEAFAHYVHSNITGTKALLDACVGRDVRLVYASSSSVYGDAVRLPVTEDVALHPISPYGASKVMTEMMAGAYARWLGLHVVGLRYFTVYGPRQRPDMGLSRFIESAAAGSEIAVYGDGRQLRDFTYVDDAVAATILAAERGRPGRVYNVASGRPLPLLDVVAELGEVMGLEPSLRFEEPKPGDVRDTHASIELAGGELGYAPRAGLREGLAAQVEEAARRRETLAAAY